MSGYDAQTSGGTASSDTATVSHTCTGTNRALYSVVYAYDSGVTPAVPTTLLYNSVAMTEVDTVLYAGNERFTLFRLENPSSGANNNVLTQPASYDENFIMNISSDDTLQTASLHTALKETPAGTVLSLTPTTVNGELVISFATVYDFALAVTGGETERTSASQNTQNFSSSTEVAGGATTNMSWSVASSGNTAAHYAVGVKAFVASDTLEQEGFRWRNDNGSETTATWEELQDVNMTAPILVTKRIRILVNGSGDPDPAAVQIEYKVDGESDTTYKVVH